MTGEELLHNFESIKDITGPDVPVLIEYAINSDLSISDAIKLREILSVKINEYKTTLMDQYQQASNEVARKKGIDAIPIPGKHLEDITNRIKFQTINLCGNFDLIIADFQGQDTYELAKSQDEEMKLIKSQMFKFDNELKNKHYTLDHISREKRTHKKYIIESEKIGRKVGPEVYAQLNSLDLLEEDLKAKHPISCLANTHSEFQKFDYIHIALVCHYAGISENEKISEFLQHFDKTRGCAIPRKFKEKLNFYIQKKNRIDFYGGKKSGLHLSGVLQKVIIYLEANNLDSSEAKSDLLILNNEIDLA